MLSMSLATLGWGTLWGALALRKLWPAAAPSLFVTLELTWIFALAGFVLALLTLRAGLHWALLTCVPLFANGSLLALPLLLEVGEGEGT